MSEDRQDQNKIDPIEESLQAQLSDELADGTIPTISIAAESRPYVRDELFKELLSTYQNAEWDQSLKILQELVRLYPEEPSLIEFQEDIRMRSMLYQKGSKSQKVETRLRIGQLSIWLIASIVAIAALFFLGQWAFSEFSLAQEESRIAAEAAAEAQAQLTKFNNAKDYLAAERPDQALEELLQLQQVSPDYPGLEELIETALARIGLSELYEQGVGYLEEGDLASAYSALQEVYQQDSNYRDVSQLLLRIETDQNINQMVSMIRSAYEEMDWQTVITNYHQILEIDPAFSMPELDEELFISYMNLVILIADQHDATMDDINLAEDYYRSALSLFPQDPDFAAEREELERVATSLINNKLYIYAVSLLETEDYSVQALQEAIRILNRANTIGSGSPAISTEISLARAFLSAYQSFTNRDYDAAILGFENVMRLEADYGGGILRYLLYEAHIARGDIFTSYGDFDSAQQDYESAETYAWGEEGSVLQLFQVEIKIGHVLRRRNLYTESAAYFNYAARLIDLEQYIDPSQTLLIETFQQAEAAYRQGQVLEASRLYDIVFRDANYIFPQTSIRVYRGDSLLHLAFHYGSTLDFIRAANSLGDAIETRNDQELVVPTLEPID